MERKDLSAEAIIKNNSRICSDCIDSHSLDEVCLCLVLQRISLILCCQGLTLSPSPPGNIAVTQ